MIDVEIIHTNGVITKSTQIECDFDVFIEGVSLAKSNKCFVSLPTITFNPDHIISVKLIKETKEEL